MSKRPKLRCKDCYFHQEALCALQLDAPCPTFRLGVQGALTPPIQAPLVQRVGGRQRRRPLPLAAPGCLARRGRRARARRDSAAGAAAPGRARTRRPATPAAHGRPQPEPVDTGSPWRFWLKVAALLFFVGYAVAFVVGNSKAISVDFVFATARVSLIWSVLLLLLVGFVAGVLASHLYRQRRSKKRRKP